MSEATQARTRLYVPLLVFVLPPSIVLTDLIITFARGFQTTSDLWTAVAGLCGLWIVVGLWQVATVKRRHLFQKRGPRLAALSVSLCLGWFAMEVCLNTVFAPNFVFHLAPGNTSHKFEPEPGNLRGVGPVANYTTNSLGIRGPEWPERSHAERILCVGGSTTECLFLDDSQTWPRLVADRLAADGGKPTWVGDVGRSGYASNDHLRLLENEELLSEVDCLVFLLGINDLQRAMRGRRLDVPFGLRPLYEYSAAFKLIDKVRTTRRTRRRHMDEAADASTYPLRRQMLAKAPLAKALPDLTVSREQYRRNLNTIADVCAARGIQAWFATQPVMWGASSSEDQATFWLGWFADGTKPEPSWLAGEMAAFNDVLRTFCRERNVGLIDLEQMNNESQSFYDDCHFTIIGAQRVADLVAAALRSR